MICGVSAGSWSRPSRCSRRPRVLRAGVRPATALICQFITEHREEFGVVPICRALTSLGAPIAPRTYHAHMARPPSKQALWDVTVTVNRPGDLGGSDHCAPAGATEALC